MRKTLVVAAVATVLSAGAFLTSGANAMTLAAPAGVRVAAEGLTTAEQVRYVCWRERRHGVWRRVCRWRPNYYAAAPYYGYGYGYRPYYSQPYGYGGYYGYRRPGLRF